MINQFENQLCIKNESLIIGGAYLSDYFSNIMFEISKCQNSTNSNITCKTNEEIDYQFDGKNFQFFFIAKVPNTDNFSQPYTQFLDNYFLKVDTALYKSVDIYFKYTEIISDTGYIFEDLIDTSLYNFDYYKEQLTVSKRDNNIFLRFYLNVSQNEHIYSRYYMKFQELAALVGGIMKIIVVIGMITTRFFFAYDMDVRMINHFFGINEGPGYTQFLLNESKLRLSKHMIHKNISTNLQIDYNKKRTTISNWKKADTEPNKENNSKHHNELTFMNKGSYPNLYKLSDNSFAIPVEQKTERKFTENNIKGSEVSQESDNVITNKNIIFDIDSDKQSSESEKSNFNNKYMRNNIKKPTVHDPLRRKEIKRLSAKEISERNYNSKAIFRYFHDRDNQLYQVSYYDVLVIAFCSFSMKRKKQKNLFLFLRDKLRETTDFIEIIKQIISFRKFKQIFFNEAQLKVHDFNHKIPMNELTKVRIVEKELNEENINDFIDDFNTVMNYDDAISTKLIDQYDKGIVNIFMKREENK